MSLAAESGARIEVVGSSLTSESLELRKSALLGAIAASRRDGSRERRAEIFHAARALEEVVASKDYLEDGKLVEGRWALVYSTQEMEGSAGLGDDESIIDKITAQTYRFFFRFAPALAGAQGGDDSKGNALGVGFRSRNEQNVDLVAGTVRNVVEVTLPAASWRFRLIVEGEAQPLANGDPLSLRIIFTRFSVDLAGDVPAWLPSLPALPLPRPVGQLNTTFVDADMRVSRGGRGGLFVLKRLKSEEA